MHELQRNSSFAIGHEMLSTTVLVRVAHSGPEGRNVRILVRRRRCAAHQSLRLRNRSLTQAFRRLLELRSVDAIARQPDTIDSRPDHTMRGVGRLDGEGLHMRRYLRQIGRFDSRMCVVEVTQIVACDRPAEAHFALTRCL